MASRGASTQDLIDWRMRALGLWPTPASEQSEPGRPSDPGGASNTSGVDGATGPGGPRGSAQDRLRAVAERLLALQGQDWNASRWALGVRATGTVDADVLAAFDSGALVRSWPMRGTIHVLAAEDLGWMQAATNHRTLPGAPKRRAFIGLDDASLARMVDIAVERLTGGRSLSRDELGQAWTEAGIGTSEQGVGPWRYHVVWWLCQNGITVPGPVNGTPGERAAASGDAHADAYAYAYADADDPAGTGRERAPEPRLVLAEEWITNPRKLEGEEALAELAARFARGRGPVQAKDLAWWTGLTLREVRRGIAAAIDDGRLVEVEIEGVAHIADPALLDGAVGGAIAGAATDDAATRGAAPADALLLPSFDEHLLGYTERGAVLDPAHFERIVPGRNGMFRATVVEGGRVVGVWTKKPLAKRTRLVIEPFPGAEVDLARLQAPAESWGAFQGVDVELVRA